MSFPKLESLYVTPLPDFSQTEISEMEHLTQFFFSFENLICAPEGSFCISVLNMLQKMPNLQLFAITAHVGSRYDQIFEIICRAIVLATIREKKVCITLYATSCDSYSLRHKGYEETTVLNIERKHNHDRVTKFLESETFNITWSGLNFSYSIPEDLEKYLKKNLNVDAYTFHSYKKVTFPSDWLEN